MSIVKINIQQVVDAVSKASKTLMFAEPFYGLFLIGMNKGGKAENNMNKRNFPK